MEHAARTAVPAGNPLYRDRDQCVAVCPDDAREAAATPLHLPARKSVRTGEADEAECARPWPRPTLRLRRRLRRMERQMVHRPTKRLPLPVPGRAASRSRTRGLEPSKPDKG